MTFEEWKTLTQTVDARATRIERMISDRAKAAFDAAFGGSEAYSCFHYVGNWQGQSWLTPEQNRVCRLVQYLGEKRWEAHGIAERISARAWKKHRLLLR